MYIITSIFVFGNYCNNNPRQKANAIVNVISSDPAKKQGILARAIFQTAGVLNQLLNNKQQTLSQSPDDVIVTSAGELADVNFIFHCYVPDYVSQSQGALVRRALIFFTCVFTTLFFLIAFNNNDNNIFKKRR